MFREFSVLFFGQWFIDKDNFRDMRDFFSNFYTQAINRDNTSQLKCFGTGKNIVILYNTENISYILFFCLLSVYPESCNHYLGPHTVQCLDEIWIQEDCILDSEYSPGNLSSTDFANISALSIGYFII